MPVYVLEHEMPYDEFLKWNQYFEERPYQWRDDDRASKQIMAFGAKIKPEDVFESLAKLKSVTRKSQMKDGEISGNNLKKSSMFLKLLSAEGGDRPGWLND